MKLLKNNLNIELNLKFNFFNFLENRISTKFTFCIKKKAVFNLINFSEFINLILQVFPIINFKFKKIKLNKKNPIKNFYFNALKKHDFLTYLVFFQLRNFQLKPFFLKNTTKNSTLLNLLKDKNTTSFKNYKNLNFLYKNITSHNNLLIYNSNTYEWAVDLFLKLNVSEFNKNTILTNLFLYNIKNYYKLN